MKCIKGENQIVQNMTKKQYIAPQIDLVHLVDGESLMQDPISVKGGINDAEDGDGKGGNGTGSEDEFIDAKYFQGFSFDENSVWDD